MIKPMKTAASWLALGFLLSGLVACERRETPTSEGPAERVGQQLDQAAARAGEELNKVAEKAGQGMQALGEKLENKAQDAQQKE